MFAAKIGTTSTSTIKNWRAKLFPFVAGFFTVALLIAGSFEFIPAWILRDPNEEVHLWHIAELTALSALLFAGTLLLLLRHAETKPLLAQFLVGGIAILALAIVPFDLKAAGLFIAIGLFVALYPAPRALVSFSRQGRVSKPLLGLSLLLAVFLLPVAFKEVQWQIMGMTENDVHALDLHWIGSAVLIVLLILAGVLSSTKRAGWKQLGIISGVVYCYLGVIALLLQSDYAGSWGGAGGLFTIIAGVWYILLTVLEAHQTKEVVSTPAPVNRQEALPVRITQQLETPLKRRTGQLLQA